MSEYPSWVKPHLRRRLEEAVAERDIDTRVKKDPTQGLTNPSTSVPAQPKTTLTVGDQVMVQKPACRLRAPGWNLSMDSWDGKWMTITRIKILATYTEFSVAENRWKFNPDWITQRR